MSGPQYPGPDPNYPGGNPGQGPDLGKGGPAGPPPGNYPPPQGNYPPPQGSFPPPPPPVDAGQYGQPGAISGVGQPAGAGIRLGARIIDSIIVWIALFIISLIFVLLIDNWVVSLIVSIILSVAGVAYFVLFESRSGATPGKQLLKLKVIGPDGGNPTPEVSLKRNWWMLIGVLSTLLSFFWVLSFILGLATLAILVALGVTISNNPQKEGFHDKFAGTKVLKVG